MDTFLTIICIALAVVVGAFVWKTYEEIQRKKKQKEMIQKGFKILMNKVNKK